MNTKKGRKNAKLIGTVLSRVTDLSLLSKWWDHLVSLEASKASAKTQTDWWNAFTTFGNTANPALIFTAHEPKSKDKKSFEEAEGLLVFYVRDAKVLLQKAFPQADFNMISNDAGLISIFHAKERLRVTGKAFLASAERMIAENQKQIYVLILKEDASHLRLLKTYEYEEAAQMDHCLLLTKKL